MAKWRYLVGAIVAIAGAQLLQGGASRSLLSRASQIQEGQPVQTAVQLLGKPQQQVPIVRYVWQGQDFVYWDDFWVLPSGKRRHPNGALFAPVTPKPSKAYSDFVKRLLDLPQHASFEEVVQVLGRPTRQVATNLEEYWWRSGREVVILQVRRDGTVGYITYYETQ
ncbi:MAG: hypothetical protein ACK4QL_05820 [Pseudanabaenaceae cyanobacterium]